MGFFDNNVSMEPLIYNYYTSLTHHGTYRTVVLFDLPTQNVITCLYPQIMQPHVIQ